MRYIVEPKVLAAVLEEGRRAKEKLQDHFRMPKFEYKTVMPEDAKEVYRLCAIFGDQEVIQRDGFVAKEK